MAKVALCWEMGGGYGHVARLASFAAPLVADGHRVTALLADVHHAARHFEELGVPWLAAPRQQSRGDPRRALFSHAEIMKVLGFDDPRALYDRVAAWRNLLDLVEPDLLIHDHSPTALLATRGRDIPQIYVGTGFTAPPQVSPFPNLRPWVAGKEAHIRTVEDAVLSNARDVTSRLDAPSMDSLQDLFEVDRKILTTYAELDHYQDRPEPVDYWGVTPPPAGEAFEWPGGEGRKVFAYLKPFKTLVPFLDALKDSGARVVVHIAAAREALEERYAGSSLRISRCPLDIGQAAREAELCVTTGGQATVCHMLLAGVPVMVLPQQLEQMLTGKILAQSGMGTVAPRLKPEGMKALLGAMLTEDGFGEAAEAFAQRNQVTPGEEFDRRVREVVGELL